MNKTLILSLLATAGAVHAGTLAVDGFRNVGVTVESDRTATQADTVRFGDGGAFIKAGAGELVLPLEKVDKTKDYGIRVSEGSLVLQPGTDGGDVVAAPAVIAEKAAFWVDAADASGSVVTEGEKVTRWCDRRETNPAAPTRWNARPKSAGGGSKRIDQTLAVKDGRKAVYFGGYDTANDNYMKFSEGNTEQKLSGVCHMFAVHGVYECWGTPIGATANPCDWFVSSVILPYPGTIKTHFIQYANTMSGLFTGRTFLDGERIDPLTVPPKAGFQLLETEFTDVPTIVDAFYNMKNTAGRQGGDYLSEAIVFTNALTATERLEIEDYLMRKWNLGNARTQDGVGRVATAPGTKVGVDVAESESLAFTNLTFSGEGTFAKEGPGTLVVGKGQLLGFRGEFDLKAGTAAVRAARLPALKVAAGEKIESVVSYPGAYTKPDCTNPVWYAQCGFNVSKSAASAPDRIEKTGNDTLTVQEIPADVKRVVVSEGTLTLAAPSTASALVAGAPLKATIPNADFELPCEANTGYNRCLFSAGTVLNGWTRSSKYTHVGYLVENYSPGDVGPAPQHGRSTMSPTPIAQGVQALIICNHGEAYTDAAVFPKSGYYTLSLLESSRFNTEQTGSYRVKLGVTWATATERAVRLVNAQNFRRVRIDLGYVEAGTYCLGFSAFAGNTQNYVDGALILDDLSVDYVGETADEGIVRIPNGDFEACTNLTLATGSGSVNPVLAYARSSNNEAIGWTFANDSADHPAVALGSTVTPVSRPVTGLSNDNYRPSDIVDGLYGSLHLTMFGTAGSASTTFTLEKGRYRLRGKALHRGGNFDTFSYAQSLSSTVAAKVTVGGEETALGSVTVKSNVLASFDWPVTFDVTDAEGEVTLTLNQTETKGMCLVDDLVLVKESAFVAYDEELIRNGSFEQAFGSTWVTFKSRVRGQSVERIAPSLANPHDDVPAQFGPLPYNGDYYLYVSDDAGLYQTLSLVPGVYRLTFAAHTRNTTGYDKQPIRAWLGDASGNPIVEIGRTPFLTTLFDQEFVWEFRVAEAGTYRLYLQGTDDFDTAGNRHTSVIDGVSLKRVRETDVQPSLSENTQLNLAEGTRLRLDYDGTAEVKYVYYGGRRYQGELSSATHPEFIDGRGVLQTAPPPGMMIIVH